ncbi:MAG: hypothetical protein H6679_04925 [Epsilonproteobacteria bacterium]|nr:hypothetical protein [Campylobacterota bacterium]
MSNTQTIDLGKAQRFKYGFKWTLAGSIMYEVVKSFHIFLLFSYMTHASYGIVGALFSLIYLTTYIADFGASNTIPSYASLFTQSRKSFVYTFVHYYLLPNTPFIILCTGLCTYIFLPKFLSTQSSMFWIAPCIIVLETVRSFMRYLLHTIFLNKQVVVIELTLFFLYKASIWFCFFVMGWTLSLELIFFPHFVDSLLCVLLFSVLTVRYVIRLPSTDLTDHDIDQIRKASISKTYAMRICNCILRFARHMFTSNLLTPLFAYKFGLKSAGFFYLSSSFAHSLQSIIRYSVGFSGNALLASLKQSPLSTKKEAFGMLCQSMVNLIAPPTLFLLINYHPIVRLSQRHEVTSITVSLSLIFLLITFTEFFFMIYEQFYIVEQESSKFLLIKLIELGLLYFAFEANPYATPFSILTFLIVIRCIVFAIIASHAFFQWRLKPRFVTNTSYMLVTLACSLLCLFIISSISV